MMRSLFALLLLGAGPVRAGVATLTWWSSAVVVPDGDKVEGLAIGTIDEGWAATLA